MNNQIVNHKFPDNWDTKELREFAAEGSNNFVDGPFGSDLKVSDYTPEGVRVLQLQNLGDGVFKNKNKIYTSEVKALQLNRCITSPGDIIIAKMAEPLARAAIVPEIDSKSLIVADLIKLRVAKDVDPVYLVNYINFSDFRKEADRLSTGSTRTRISLSTLKSISLPCPPLDKQQKIASVLNTVDNLINQTQNLIDKYTAVKQGMMADLFSRGIDLSGTPEANKNYGQLRSSYAEAPELYQETELGWVPQDWDVVKIDNISTQMTNGFVGVATPHYANENEAGIRYLYGNNVRADKLELDTVLKIKPEFHQKLQKSQLRQGDMLTVQSGHIGTTAIVPPNFGEANCHALIITRLVQSKILPEFLSFYLNSAIGMNRMEEIFVGSTIKHVNVKELKSFLVPLPSIGEQQAVLDKIIGARKLLDDESRYLEKLNLKKKGLMQDLLTGKVKV